MMPDPLLEAQGAAVRAAARVLAVASTTTKNDALLAAAASLRDRTAVILPANERDVEAASADGMALSGIDRLRLDGARIAAMAGGLEAVAGLADPIGEVVEGSVRPNGLRVERVRVPLGVIGVIYENRPNVTSDAAGLCLKAGSAAYLRGSASAQGTNLEVVAALGEGLAGAGLPKAADQPRGGHIARDGRAVHAAARRHRLPHPEGRQGAHRSDARARHGALRPRRRRQLPRVRRRDS